MIRRPAAAHGTLQDQGELVANPLLADEVGEALGPQRALDGAVVGVGERRHQPVRVRAIGTRAVEGLGLPRLQFVLGDSPVRRAPGRCLPGRWLPVRRAPGHWRLSFFMAARSTVATSAV